MKKVLFYLLLIVIVTDNTSLNQLLKIGFIFQHYSEHRELDNSLTLVDFLSMHYWGQDLPDHDDVKDNQLPFKKVVVNLHYDFFSPFRQPELKVPIMVRARRYNLPKNYDLPEAYLHTLFKPPRTQTIS